MTLGRRPSSPPVLDGYEVRRLLGMGGFADVFLYEQQMPRRSVAVKVLLADTLDTEVRARFGTEADLMAQLSHHPSIVTIHQADVAADGRPYLVMEYCSRPGLGARYRSERMSVAEVLRIGIRLASAVETAHRAGILHRDIKPANVLVTDFGWPALTDFGIAATTGWSRGSAVGMSIPWSPPELLAESPTGDVRADVYSLAATIYSLLAGRSPFEIPGGANSPADLVARIERAPLPVTGRADVPASLQAALARAMDKNPLRRFHSALGLARALQAVEHELMLPGTPVELADDVVAQAPAGGPAPATTVPVDDAATRQRGVVSIDPEGPALGTPAPTAPVGRTAAQEAAEATRVRPVRSIRPEGPGSDVVPPAGPSAGSPRPDLAAVPAVPAVPATPATPAVPVTPAVPALTSVGSGGVPRPARSTVPAPRTASVVPTSAVGAGAVAGPGAETTHGPTRPAPHRADAGGPVDAAWTTDAAPAGTAAAAAPVGAHAVAPAAGTPAHGVEAPARRVARRRARAAAAAVVVVGALGAAAVLAGPEPTPPASAATTAIDGAPVVVTAVPSPQDLSVVTAPDGSAVVTWTNPQPQDGDRYLWGVTHAGASAQLQMVDEPTAVVAAGAQRPVCVEVSIVRADRRASTRPAVGCAP